MQPLVFLVKLAVVNILQFAEYLWYEVRARQMATVSIPNVFVTIQQATIIMPLCLFKLPRYIYLPVGGFQWVTQASRQMILRRPNLIKERNREFVVLGFYKNYSVPYVIVV